MGCSESKPAQPAGGPPPDPAKTNKSRAIDTELERDRRAKEKTIKMLLLGPGESGKSTIFKQMRLLYGTERSDDELRMYGVVARSNIVVATRKLCSLLHDLGLEEELDRESADESCRHSVMTCRQAYDDLLAYLVENTATASVQDPLGGGGGAGGDWVGRSPRAGIGANHDAKLFLAHHDSIYTLWQSKTMKQAWAQRSKMNVVDTHKVFLDDIPRIASPDFKPTIQDVLNARIRTTQVVLEKYRIQGTKFEIYDVGGQRSERRKWLDCFDSVTALIFVAALSEYDQTLTEAKRTNRMVESLEVFRSVCNNRAFKNTSILLFLNKKDIFNEKIVYSDIAAQRPFGDYSGPKQDIDQGVAYFIGKFKDSLTNNALNDAFIHVTTATDRNNMGFVLDSARTMIMAEALKRSGFLGSD